jgi:hypothetical protein
MCDVHRGSAMSCFKTLNRFKRPNQTRQPRLTQPRQRSSTTPQTNCKAPLALLTPNTSTTSLASLYRSVLNLQARNILSAPPCTPSSRPQSRIRPPAHAKPSPARRLHASGLKPDGLRVQVRARLARGAPGALGGLLRGDGRCWVLGGFRWVEAVGRVLETAGALLLGMYAADGSVNQLPYTWMRSTASATETLGNEGRGDPVQDCTELVRSAFRPSDDTCV